MLFLAQSKQDKISFTYIKLHNGNVPLCKYFCFTEKIINKYEQQIYSIKFSMNYYIKMIQNDKNAIMICNEIKKNLHITS